jgi:hypothetical protein
MRPHGTPSASGSPCPHIVCIVALGLDAVPLRRGATPHVERLADAGHTCWHLPKRWQMARLAAFGYHTALIGGDTQTSDNVQALGDEAARFIGAQTGEQPFVLSIALPCSREDAALRRFDRAVGQVITALQDWGHEPHTLVLLGPVRPRAAVPAQPPFVDIDRAAEAPIDRECLTAEA